LRQRHDCVDLVRLLLLGDVPAFDFSRRGWK